jgi:peptidoglycan/LPS O-acetylase OafA/YrhL
MPVIFLCHWLLLKIHPGASKSLTFFVLALLSIPVILVASELLYRLVERPGIALGSRLARPMKIETVHVSG